MTFFHLGQFFQKRVAMHVVEGGQAREIIYEQSYFDMPADSPAQQMPKGAGFAGFRFQESARRRARLAARTTGSPFSAPPISARSASSASTACRRAASRIDAADRRTAPEEFPDFTEFCIEAGAESDDKVTRLRPAGGPLASPAPSPS